MRTIKEILGAAPEPKEFDVHIDRKISEKQFRAIAEVLQQPFGGRYKSYAESSLYTVSAALLPALDEYLRKQRLPYYIEATLVIKA